MKRVEQIDLDEMRKALVDLISIIESIEDREIIEVLEKDELIIDGFLNKYDT